MTTGSEPRDPTASRFDGPSPPNQRVPLDYPTDPGLPPPVHDAGQPPTVHGIPGYGATGYPYTAGPVPSSHAPPPYPGPLYGAGGYDPYAPYPGVAPPGTNGKAIAALVTSLAGLLFCGLPSIVGMILGIVAMRETRTTGQDGFGLALAGTIVGALVTVGYVLYFVVFIGILASGFSLV